MTPRGTCASGPASAMRISADRKVARTDDGRAVGASGRLSRRVARFQEKVGEGEAARRPEAKTKLPRHVGRDALRARTLGVWHVRAVSHASEWRKDDANDLVP